MLQDTAHLNICPEKRCDYDQCIAQTMICLSIGPAYTRIDGWIVTRIMNGLTEQTYRVNARWCFQLDRMAQLPCCSTLVGCSSKPALPAALSSAMTVNRVTWE